MFLVKAIIDRTATNEALETIHCSCKQETEKSDINSTEFAMKKNDFLIALESSSSFSRTHKIISEMREVDNWTSDEKEILYRIALINGQVRYVLSDVDVNMFYRKLLSNTKELSENGKKIKELIEKTDED